MGYQIGIDVGGAFTDLLVCDDDGRTPHLQVAYYACRSIAGVDDGGMLHVGPASAGANAEVELINLHMSATGATTKPKTQKHELGSRAIPLSNNRRLSYCLVIPNSVATTGAIICSG